MPTTNGFCESAQALANESQLLYEEHCSLMLEVRAREVHLKRECVELRELAIVWREFNERARIRIDGDGNTF